MTKTKRQAELEEMELKGCTFAPEIHTYDKEAFNDHPADKIIKNYMAKRAQSKEKAEQVEKLVKKNRMKL